MRQWLEWRTNPPLTGSTALLLSDTKDVFCSLILSHPAQTVALGGSVKTTDPCDSSQQCWSSHPVCLYDSGNYSTSEFDVIFFFSSGTIVLLLRLLLLIGKFTSKWLEEEQRNTKTQNESVRAGCDCCISVLHSRTLACKTGVIRVVSNWNVRWYGCPLACQTTFSQ